MTPNKPYLESIKDVIKLFQDWAGPYVLSQLIGEAAYQFPAIPIDIVWEWQTRNGVIRQYET